MYLVEGFTVQYRHKGKWGRKVRTLRTSSMEQACAYAGWIFQEYGIVVAVTAVELKGE